MLSDPPCGNVLCSHVLTTPCLKLAADTVVACFHCCEKGHVLLRGNGVGNGKQEPFRNKVEWAWLEANNTSCTSAFFLHFVVSSNSGLTACGSFANCAQVPCSSVQSISTSWLTTYMCSSFRLTELLGMHRMIKLGLSIDEDDVVGEDADEDLPPLEENVDEGSRMEEVD